MFEQFLQLEKSASRVPRRHAMAPELLQVFTKDLERGANGEGTRLLMLPM